MRAIVAGSIGLLLLAPTAGALAQSPFEGTLTMKMGSDPGAPPKLIKLWAKGGKMRMETSGAGATMTVLADGRGAITMLMPAQKQYYTMMRTAELMKSAASGPVTLRKLGRGGAFSGYRCEWYQMMRDRTAPVEACVTRDLGSLGIDLAAQGGQGGLNDADLSAFRREFGTDFFVLQQKGAGGEVLYEVTQIARGAVADATFQLPARYTELKMPGAGRKR